MSIQEQPMNGQTAFVVVQQPKCEIGARENIRPWSSGICGCCEAPGVCCYACCCNPCFMCDLSGRMGECACGSLWLCCPFVVGLRTKVRIKYGLTGSVLDDCCMVTCCPLLSCTQMRRELDFIGRTSIFEATMKH